MQRSIDAPDKVWSNAREAAEWLGLTEDGFLGEARRYPSLLPATKKGRGLKWHWMDLVGYSHYTRQAGPPLPEVEK